MKGLPPKWIECTKWTNISHCCYINTHPTAPSSSQLGISNCMPSKPCGKYWQHFFPPYILPQCHHQGRHCMAPALQQHQGCQSYHHSRHQKWRHGYISASRIPLQSIPPPNMPWTYISSQHMRHVSLSNPIQLLIHSLGCRRNKTVAARNRGRDMDKGIRQRTR